MTPTFTILTLIIMLSQTPAPRGGKLPWRATDRTEKFAATAPISTREMLGLQGIGESQLEQLRDGLPLSPDEDESLSQLMHRLPRIEPPLWEAWRQPTPPWQELATMPRKHRAQSYLIAGRASHIERVAIRKELVARFEYRNYFRVTLAVEGYEGSVVVLTREIPAAWQKLATLDERVRIDALFLKCGETVANAAAPLYFAAARVGWLPDAEDAALGATANHVWLAERGFDLSLFDAVRTKNGGPIGAEEGECFYQLLGAVGNATPAELEKLSARPFDLAPLLVEPEHQHGRAFLCRGIARRVQKVSVPERFRARLKIDHYYEIDLFVPLDNRQPVRLMPREGEEGPTAVIAGEFPTTFCVARLPAELGEGENVRTMISLKGVFFKKWAYQSEFLDQVDQRLRQPSPLLIGQEPTVIEHDESSGWSTTSFVIFAAAIVGGITAIWIGAWRIARGDRAFHRRVLRKYRRPDGSEKE